MRPTVLKPLIPRDFLTNLLNAILSYVSLLKKVPLISGILFHYDPAKDAFCIKSSFPSKEENFLAYLQAFLDDLQIIAVWKDDPRCLIKRNDLIPAILRLVSADEKQANDTFEKFKQWLSRNFDSIHTQLWHIQHIQTAAIFHKPQSINGTIPLHRSLLFHRLFEPQVSDIVLGFAGLPVNENLRKIQLRDELRSCILRSCSAYLKNRQDLLNASFFSVFSSADSERKKMKVEEMKKRITDVKEEVPTFRFLLTVLAEFCQSRKSENNSHVSDNSFIKFFLLELKDKPAMLAILDFSTPVRADDESYRQACFEILYQGPRVSENQFPLLSFSASDEAW